ncbi:MAG: cell wall-binding repeat-containing protein [Acidimicrobiaceae bacterium]|nr:cell wall-binding repeat-containing protein [Acidimicrobiaceae bacterium]
MGSAGSSGVSGAVQSALVAKGYVVERVSGNTRSGTSVAVARRLGELLRSRSSTSASVGSMQGYGETAIVASSETFADALVAEPASAYGAHPVLLTSPGSLDADISMYLAEAAVKHGVLMGGTAALGAPVERSLDGLGLKVTKLAGATRFETAVLCQS